MATSVLLACGLNDPLPPACTFVRQDTGVDASFLLTCILGQRTKVQTAGTVLLCLHHSFQHYAGAAIRLGFNLQAARDKGALRIVEPLADCAARSDNAYLSAAGPDALLAELWRRVRTELADLLAVPRKSVTICLDDLTALLDLGVPDALLVRFVRQLVQLTAVAAAAPVSLVLKLGTSQLYEQLASNLAALADAEIRCERLRSGNFREVDGRLVSVRRPDAAGARHQTAEKSMLYKVNERSIKIFAPGEVGISI